jgi:hypothetical protein
MHKKHPVLAFGALALLLLTSVQVYAGGPLLLRAAGVPFLWPNGGRMIPFNPDLGGLGPLTNAQAVAQSTAAFQAWADIVSATATHVNRGQLPVDVDETNFLPYLEPTAPDGLSAIVYDEDGAIFELLFGEDSGVLGFASPEWINTATGDIIEGVSFMNGGALVGPDAFPVAEMLSVQVHEYGHYQNLAHTVVNGQIIAGPDSRGPSPFNTFAPPPTFAGRIETMYPFLFVNGGQATPHADDIAIFSRLYPEPTFATTRGSITGRILAPNNTTPLTGVNVIARNVANPYDDAVSAISSDFAVDYASGSPFVGVYTLRGLTPNASYAVYVDQILEGGFSTPPRILPGPEEFYNGPTESNDSITDPPGNTFTPVAAVAGVRTRDIDIIFNRFLPGPLPAGDDTSTELFPDFKFEFCGQRYDSVFVNSNGSLSFGTGSLDFSESIADMLTGPPRIAGLWDDLDASAAPGSVTFSETSRSLTVSFTNVPEFDVPGGNTFSITLFGDKRNGRGDWDDDEGGWWGRDDGHRRGRDGRFNISYGALSATDGLAGYSCGGRITSGFEKETDLSKASRHTIDGDGKTAIFEIFSAVSGANDLSNRRLEFEGPGGFRDVFEPNDSAVPAMHDRRSCGHDDHDDRGKGLVRLPFNTANRFTDISPIGNDVDFFRFRAKAGDILAIETVPGLQAMDTVLGIFDDEGNLLAANDDGGAGTLSRLLVQVAVDGTYAVGVSTYPDLTFTGAGGDFGRYVLNISSYRGTILDFGTDPLADASVEIGLSTFEFPFQGTNWSSVFVNDNGNLTFGARSADFSETVAELLSGPPRIAPLWDDLNVLGGLVIAEEKDRALHIHFVSVPEFEVTGTNYFTVKLDRRGDITFDYGATNRSDALVGISQGGGTADPGPTDLSETRRLWTTGTIYEQFVPPASFATYGGIDLSFQEVVFKNPR